MFILTPYFGIQFVKASYFSLVGSHKAPSFHATSHLFLDSSLVILNNSLFSPRCYTLPDTIHDS